MKKGLKALLFVFLGIVGIFLLIALWNFILTKIELKSLDDYGMAVSVNGRQMRVYDEGEGDHTIVLLPGLGTAAPYFDFAPLRHALSINNRVVVVEPFGYGLSQQTDTERSADIIVEEIHTALQEASIDPPYVLVPHSLSGYYALAFASKYPDETEAFIGIEPTLPQEISYFDEEIPSADPILGALLPMGIIRIMVMSDPAGAFPEAPEGTYTQEELDAILKIAKCSSNNRNVINEMNNISADTDALVDIPFDQELPVLIFSRESPDGVEPRADGRNNLTFYQSVIDGLKKGKVVQMNGHHYLHWTNAEEMAEMINDFLK